MKNTEYLTVSDADIKIAAEILKSGGTVIFPTETVYGLGANALDARAVNKIFEAKGRPSDNPLIVHIANEKALTELTSEIPEKAKKLIKEFWPGPLTIIFKKSDKVPKAVTGGLDTVAVRMPSQPVARALIAKSGIPVAAPSANLSGKPSPTSFVHVKEDMDGRVDAVIDGGDCEVGVESTVLDLSGDKAVLYRPGRITLEQLEDIIGKIEIVTKAVSGETPKSPGLKYRHYAPNAEVRILHGSVDQVREYAKKHCSAGKTGMLAFDEFPDLGSDLIVHSLGSCKNPEEAAHRLFAALRQLDAQGVKTILAPEIPETGVWRAVRNRLYRAAGENIVDLTIGCPKKILLVCTGNTCRSPMAEGLLKSMTYKENISVSSAGLSAAEGATASQNAVLAMREKGFDISSHRARQITAEMINGADLVLTMTETQRRMLLAAVRDADEKIMTLAQWADTEEEVEDPFGGDLDSYRRCRNQIEMLLSRGWGKYK